VLTNRGAYDMRSEPIARADSSSSACRRGYTWESSLPGFANLKAPSPLPGATSSRTSPGGRVTETISITAKPGAAGAAASPGRVTLETLTDPPAAGRRSSARTSIGGPSRLPRSLLAACAISH
jgi:hypothetical protein